LANYRRFTVPYDGLVLVTGVDVQDNRFEVVTWAIGRGEEMWCVDYSVIYANPADERNWAHLDAYRKTIFQHTSGQAMRIEAMAVDTGGHFPHQAYNYCRQRERERGFVVRGDPQPSKMVKGELTPELVKGVEAGIRADWGGDRVFIAKRRGEGHGSRNSRIFRDYLAGERVKLFSRRYELSERQLLRIIKAPQSD
jgi:hypothetical protein